MPNNFILTLDTLGPQSPSVLIENGSAFIADPLVNLTLGTSSDDVSQMKIWGDLDVAQGITDGILKADSIVADEVSASWISFSTEKQIKLATGDGNKQVFVKFRDDVHNESSTVSAMTTLDTTIPVVTIVSGPSPNKISKISGKDVAEFVFQSDETFIEYRVMVVPNAGASRTAGVQIPSLGGSTNMTGSGTFSASTNITCQIRGTDLETASSGDGDKIIKVFVKDQAGNWSA